MSSRWNAVYSRLAKAGVIGMAMTTGFATSPVMAYQDGATVVNGDVTFQQNGGHTIITASDGSIINYTNFDILPNEIVQFVQPHELATVLNRVNSNDPTLIQGQLLGNGRVFLVNPAGVVFGQGAVINVGTMFAAAGNITNQDFLSGNWQFGNLTGNVLNNGTIRANDAYLLGRHVSNRGVISANHGVIAMVAGNSVLIREHGERITIRVDGNELVGNDMPYNGQTMPDMLADPGVENAGALHAVNGQVVLGAGDLYGYALLNSGTIRADGGDVSMTAADGLVHNSGLVTTSVGSGTAGSITLQGPSIYNSGQLLADSNAGQAGSIEFTSQNHSLLSTDSLISAAGGTGQAAGGNVLVHSYNGQTVMPSGAVVDVSGGRLGGRGGFAEVSGLDLFYNGSVALGAAAGSPVGELLLDPYNVVINTNANTLPFQDFLLDGNTINFTEGTLTGNTYISSEALEAIIGDINIEALGSIFVFDSLDFGLMEGAFEQNLFLTAGGDIVVGFNTGIYGANNVTIHANAFGDSNGEVQFNAPVNINGMLEVDGALVVINTDSIVSGGNQLYLAPVDICHDTHLQAANVHFTDIVDATFSDERMSGMEVSVGDGTVVFDGDVGMADDTHNNNAPRSLAYLVVNGNTAVNAQNIRTRDHQTYNGRVDVNVANRGGSNATFQSTDGGDIRFDGGIEGTNASVNILTQGLTAINGDVGANGPLALLHTDAGGSTQLAGNHNSSVFDYDDEIMLTDDVVMSASSSANFAQQINGDGNSLDVASNFIHFEGDVLEMDTIVTRDFNAGGGGTTLIGAYSDEFPAPRGFNGIHIQGNNVDLQNNVTLIDNTLVTGLDSARFGGTVDGDFELWVESNKLIEFGGDIGSAIPLALLDAHSLELILFDGATSATAWGDVGLNQYPGTNPVPEAATIGATGNLTLESIGGDILIGQNQKLSVVGTFGAFTPNTFQSGDISALGNLNVLAGTINLLARDPGSVRLSNGQIVMDDGLDLVAGGMMIFATTPNIVGGNGNVLFVTKSGSGFSPALDGFGTDSKPDLTAASFYHNGQILDLTAGSAPPATPPANLAQALGSADFQLDDYVPLDPYALRPTDRLAIFMRAMTNEELRATVSGMHIYVDLQSPATETANPAISTMRLNRDSVLAVIRDYEKLHGVSAIDDAANEDQIEAARVEIRTALSTAWANYAQQAGENASAGQFLAYLRAVVKDGSATQADRDALEYMNGIREMYANLQIMGATPSQTRLVVDELVTPLRPVELTADQFNAALQPAS